MIPKRTFARYGSTLLIVSTLVIGSCGNQPEAPAENDNRTSQEAARNPVDTVKLLRSDFQKELISNGRLEALQKAQLRFRVSEVLAEVHVKNGDLVKKGQLLASLQSQNLQNTLAKARVAVEKATIDFQDVLISQGYQEADSASIPTAQYRNALVRSGLADARLQLKEAQRNFRNRHLRAPFSGTVANIIKKAYDAVASSEDFCTLLNDEKYQVRFEVMESELGDITTGKSIEVFPLAGGEYTGTISEINPIVNENGLVTVRGLVTNTQGKLMDGMNVNLHIRNRVPEQLVIPKSALVLRQNREVVFTLRNDSVAWWNYVTTSQENSNSYAVTDGLKEGEIIITSGNLNLAHESIVFVEPENTL